MNRGKLIFKIKFERGKFCLIHIARAGPRNLDHVLRWIA